MKTDWRIMGRPFRGARRIVAIKCGFATKEDAERARDSAVAAGDMDPDAWIRSQRVKNNYDPVKAEQTRPVPMF